MSLIVCKGLTRIYRRGTEEITPLNSLSLEVRKGEFLALMGPSGSGKTTLLNMVAGIDRPTRGELIIAGVNIAGLSRSALARWRQANVGYIFQLYNLIPVLTAYENVELPLLLSPLSAKQRHARVCEALEWAGIQDRHKHFPRQLSGGQEQRVAIARAIVTRPAILVADEPTGDLDQTSAREILELLRGLTENHQTTLLMVTHDPKAADFASRKLHLEKGVLVSEVEVPA
ncbi:MAG: ABC transporter ATP-binding protein [Candidatus Sumerlaeia bacterium]|nr:ABC transporter ATP-binding protein [Candidatus Sumerlaeia bacterium]